MIRSLENGRENSSAENISKAPQNSLLIFIDLQRYLLSSLKKRDTSATNGQP